MMNSELEAAFRAKDNDKLAQYFYQISEQVFDHLKIESQYHAEALQEGVWICFEKIKKYDPDKTGAKLFNYLTTCICGHFRQLYRKKRKQ